MTSETRGVPRRIVGFHQDDEGHWVADLECGHGQHVRHDPPWQLRPWVVTAGGRAKYIGTELRCVRCEDAAGLRRSMSDLIAREYGDGAKPAVITLHGGPAAAGDVAPLARELGTQWHALEPLQRGSSDRPLSVATHVRDLHDLIEQQCRAGKPALVGHSWGAMLALAYAAAHPGSAAALVLVGCGTFSLRSRAEFESRVSRLTPAQRNQVYGYDIDEDAIRPIVVDARAHQETWSDMIRQQADGVYPAAFAAIDVPVLMLHGEADPHPGAMICAELRPHIPQLEYRALPECSHWPWLERRARSGFYEILHGWLRAHLSEGMMAFRRQLIDLLSHEFRSVSSLARELGMTRGDVEDDLRHALRSARAAGHDIEVVPARCKSCDFVFSAEKLAKPSRCPVCKGSRLYEPMVRIRPPSL